MEKQNLKELLNSNKEALRIITAEEAVNSALKEIELNRSGEQVALYSRLPKVNQLLGGFRFNNNYVIAGMSGLGKSYYLNMLYQDFLNKELNKEFKQPFLILHFGFEMAAYDEIIRMAQKDLDMSYRDIMSIDNLLTDDSYSKVKAILKGFSNTEIYFVEASGNRNQVYETIVHFHTIFPNHKIIVGFDHTLLTTYWTEKDEIELVSKLSVMFVNIRKQFNNMNFLISQLNDKIEDDDRILKPGLHFPKKKDLHGSKQVFQCSDWVIILHAPERLGIHYYGTQQIPTKDLIAYHLIKARKGEIGFIRLKNELKKGTLTEF